MNRRSFFKVCGVTASVPFMIPCSKRTESHKTSYSVPVQKGEKYHFSTHGIWSGIAVLERDDGNGFDEFVKIESNYSKNTMVDGTADNTCRFRLRTNMADAKDFISLFLNETTRTQWPG